MPTRFGPHLIGTGNPNMLMSRMAPFPPPHQEDIAVRQCLWGETRIYLQVQPSDTDGVIQKAQQHSLSPSVKDTLSNSPIPWAKLLVDSLTLKIHDFAHDTN